MVLSAVCYQPQRGIGEVGTLCPERGHLERAATKDAGLPGLVPAGTCSALIRRISVRESVRPYVRPGRRWLAHTARANEGCSQVRALSHRVDFADVLTRTLSIQELARRNGICASGSKHDGVEWIALYFRYWYKAPGLRSSAAAKFLTFALSGRDNDGWAGGMPVTHADFVITAPRLILRPWQDSDLPLFAEQNADPIVMQFITEVLTREESDAYVEKARSHFCQNGFCKWAVEAPCVAPFYRGHWANLCEVRGIHTRCRSRMAAEPTILGAGIRNRSRPSSYCRWLQSHRFRGNRLQDGSSQHSFHEGYGAAEYDTSCRIRSSTSPRN
jgi:hypothetical protein